MIKINDRRIFFIGEVKTKSPFGFVSKYSWQYLLDCANKSKYVDMISIHVDPRWGGSYELLAEARKQTDKPILAKGYHKTDEEVRKALSHGANHVLVVGRVPHPDIADFCFIEPENLSQINIPSLLNRYTLVWNTRNLTTGEPKKETLEQARKLWTDPNFLIQASNIKTVDNIHPLADGILVGSYLPEFINSLESLSLKAA